MRRNRGFVYSTGGSGHLTAQTGTSKAASTTGPSNRGQHSTSQYGRSPLKRKRSPEALTLSSASGSRRQGVKGPGLSSKVAKTEDNPFEEDDELDDLGTAALEQYELTQHEGAVTATGRYKSPPPVSDPILVIPIPGSIPASTSAATVQSRPTTGPWCNPYLVGDGSSRTGTSGTLAAPESSEEYRERIKQLQEENYSKDGEVKVLRGEKERLMGELRKKDEQMQGIQTQLLSEKQTLEEQLTKEKDVLTTKLQFRDQELQMKEQKLQMKEQELIKLREKLEQQQDVTRSIKPPLSSSTAHVPKVTSGGFGSSAYSSSRSTSREKPEFLSTETFMPLSQMTSGNVTPVQVRVGQKRGVAVAKNDEERESGGAQKKPTVKSKSKSPSVSPSSSGSGAKTATLSGKVSESKPRARKGQASLGLQEPGTIPSSQEREMGVVRTTGSERRRPYWILDVPKKEPTGAQLLMLLVQRDLLKVPSFSQPFDLTQDNVYSDSHGNSQSSMDSQSTESTSTVQHQQHKLTGLLSLLHLETGTSRLASTSMPHYSSGESSASQSSSSEEHSLLISESGTNQIPSNFPAHTPSSSATSASTPARKAKLQLTKPHTLARTDLTRARTQQRLHSELVKSHSASSTPNRMVIGDGRFEDRNSSTLVNSINKNDLEISIAAMLRSADDSISLSSSSWPVPFGSSMNNRLTSSLYLSDSCTHEGASGISVVGLLKQISEIIYQYYSEQQGKAQASSNTSGFLVDFNSEGHLDVSSISSPKSSTGSTISSKTSSDLISPLEGDQQLASQALDLLETLATYSKAVREQILLRPPEFHIPDSRPSSALDVCPEGDEEKIPVSATHLSPTIPHLMKVSDRLSSLQSEAVAESSPSSEDSSRSVHPVCATWRGIPLVQLRCQRPAIGLSGKVWMNQKNADVTGYSTASSSDATPLHVPPRSSSCGQLFKILLELPVPPWRESMENVNTCLRILTVLAEDCTLETLERFSPLFLDDKLGVCLDKDDPQLTLSVISLLSQLVRSPAIADLLCIHTDACLPLTCYQCLVDPPASNNTDIIFRIRLQIIRLVSHLLVISNGSKIIFEKCSCSHELLKSLTTLLQRLIDGIYKLSQFSDQELLLIKETVSLMFVVSVHDPYFDTHREQCEYSYVFVLNSLSYLFSTTDDEMQEVLLVQELLEYCDEYEDSQSNSDHEVDEENGGRMDVVESVTKS